MLWLHTALQPYERMARPNAAALQKTTYTFWDPQSQYMPNLQPPSRCLPLWRQTKNQRNSFGQPERMTVVETQDRAHKARRKGRKSNCRAKQSESQPITADKSAILTRPSALVRFIQPSNQSARDCDMPRRLSKAKTENPIQECSVPRRNFFHAKGTPKMSTRKTDANIHTKGGRSAE